MQADDANNTSNKNGAEDTGQQNEANQGHIQNDAGDDKDASQLHSGDNDAADADDGQDVQHEGRTFTQDEVSKMMAREKKQGRNSAYNELGINPNDRRMVKMVKSFVSTQKNEADDGDGEPVDARLHEAERRAMIAELKADILAQNISSQFVDDAVTLVGTRLADEDGLDTNSAISDLKKKYPMWFTDTGSADDQKAKRGTGSSIGAMANSAGKSGEDERSSFGKRLAASRKASSKSGFSYFSNNK